jgi:hypothetical protein
MKCPQWQRPRSGETRRSNRYPRATAWCGSFAVSNFGALLALGAWCLALCLSTSTSRAQSYGIDWFTVDGGGGTSTGGVYSISGTIGQPDAGPAMTGGNYALTGGFWSLLAVVQTPGAPLLSIFRTTTNTVAVSWPSPSTDWTLQQNTNGLATLNWSNVTDTLADDGSTWTLVVNPPTGNRFYRLFKR